MFQATLDGSGFGGIAAPQSEADAIRYLQQVHAPVLLSFLTRMTGGDVHRAEDILQETLLRAWRNPEARTHDNQWSRAWVFTVARRIAIDAIRAAQSRPPEISDERIDTHAVVNDGMERLLDAREVRSALESLPERWRATLVAVYFHERSTEEAAQLLSVPTGTVKSRTFYGLRALREALIERGFPMEVREYQMRT